MTFVKRRPNVFDVGQQLYKFYTKKMIRPNRITRAVVSKQRMYPGKLVTPPQLIRILVSSTMKHIIYFPFSPHDALKHHFSLLKNDLIFYT